MAQRNPGREGSVATSILGLASFTGDEGAEGAVSSAQAGDACDWFCGLAFAAPTPGMPCRLRPEATCAPEGTAASSIPRSMNKMTPKERVIAQIEHQETDFVPYTLGFEGDVADRLDEHYGGPH